MNKMYAMRQIIRHDVPVELPGCMYPVTNIHRNSGVIDGSTTITKTTSATKVQQQLSADISEQNNSGLRGMAALESKQQQLLKQLEELKQQMLGIKDDLKASTPTSVSTCKKASPKAVSNKSLEVSNVPELVIKAHPDFPPYCLELLQKHWSKTVQLCVLTHVHSTVSSMPEAATRLSERLSGFVQRNANAPKICVRLIWKNTDFKQIELMVSTLPVLGECNLLRYVCRLTGGLSYDERNFEMDRLLDLSYSIVNSQTKQKRMELIQQVNRRLGKSDFVLGAEGFGVADVALYSAIKQVAQGAEINVNLGRWMKNCEAA